MAFLSALVSWFHILLLLLVPPLTFLWIIGKLKEIRLRNQLDQQQQQQQQLQLQLQQPFPQPSPTNIHLQPRRLSFSSAAASNTPTPVSLSKRRVTFSLTPEQQANELLKTAVRRRESLPSSNLLVFNQSSPTEYNPPRPQQVAHLFPSRSPPPVHSVFPPVQQQPIPIPQPQQPHQKRSTSPTPQKRKTSPNKNQNPLPKRQRNPRKATSRPSSAPVYAADLRREPQPSQLLQPPEAVREPRAVKLRPTSNPYAAPSRVLNPVVKSKPTHTPPSDKKPPKPPRLAPISKDLAPQQMFTFPGRAVTPIRRNGVVSRSVR